MYPWKVQSCWVGTGEKARPLIKEGMTEQQVIDQLGEAKARMSYEEGLKLFDVVLPNAEMRKLHAGRQYCVWNHPAGNYELVIQDGRVITVYRQPG